MLDSESGRSRSHRNSGICKRGNRLADAFFACLQTVLMMQPRYNRVMNELNAFHPASASPSTGPADSARLALIVQRLVDADLLLPEEGEELLAKIAVTDELSDRDRSESTDTRVMQFLLNLEALAQSDCLDAAARQSALETARALIQPSISPTAPHLSQMRERDS